MTDARTLEWQCGATRFGHAPWLAPAISLLLIALLTAGCADPEPSDGAASSTITLDRILERGRASYGRIRTLRARGVLRDFRAGQRRVLPVTWDFAHSNRARLQLGLSVALVLGDTWWSYDERSGQYRKHRTFTSSPMETASYLISDGVPFLLPALLSRPRTVLAAVGGRAGAWRLLGVDWSAGQPCYVICKDAGRREDSGRLRAWIDQDEHLMRAWDIVQPRADGGERVVLACEYFEIEVNSVIPAERFSLATPTPIEVPAGVLPAVDEAEPSP